jgi:hypothetical protein
MEVNLVYYNRERDGGSRYRILAAKYAGDGIFLVVFESGIVALCDYYSKWGNIREVRDRFNSDRINQFKIVNRYPQNWLVWDNSDMPGGKGIFVSSAELCMVAMDYQSNIELYKRVLSMGYPVDKVSKPFFTVEFEMYVDPDSGCEHAFTPHVHVKKVSESDMGVPFRISDGKCMVDKNRKGWTDGEYNSVTKWVVKNRVKSVEVWNTWNSDRLCDNNGFCYHREKKQKHSGIDVEDILNAYRSGDIDFSEVKLAFSGIGIKLSVMST